MTDISKMTQDELRQRIHNGGMTDAEIAAANSEANITAAINEFARRNPNLPEFDDHRAPTEIGKIVRSRHAVVTPEAIQEGYEIYCAQNMSQDDLRWLINERAGSKR